MGVVQVAEDGCAGVPRHGLDPPHVDPGPSEVLDPSPAEGMPSPGGGTVVDQIWEAKADRCLGYRGYHGRVGDKLPCQ